MAKSAQLSASLSITAGVEGIAEIEKATQALGNMGQGTRDLRTQARELREAWDSLDPKEQAQRMQALSDAYQEQADKMAKARSLVGLADDDKAKKQIEEVRKAYQLLRESGTLSQAELARAAELHRSKIAELEEQLGKVKPSLSEIAAGVAKIGSSMGSIALLTREAMQFETAMAQVRKTTGASAADMQTLSAQVKDLSVELGMSAEEVAGMVAQGGQLGVAFKDLPEFTRLAGQMAVAFGMSADAAGDAAAKLANVYGIPLADVRALGDAINVLGNNTAATEAEIVQAALRIGGTAKQFGLSAAQASALADAFIALGKPPEVAATAINAMLTKLQTAPAAGKEFQEALQSIGLDANQLADNIRNNPEAAIIDFMERLKGLDNQARAITLTNLFGAEYADDIALASGSLDTLKKALSLVANESQNAGAMQSEFEAAMDTTAKQVEQAKIAFENLMKELGTHLLPIVGEVAEGLGDMAQGLSDFAQEHPNITKLITLFASMKLAAFAAEEGVELLGDGLDGLRDMLGGAQEAITSLSELGEQAEAGSESVGKLGKATEALNKAMQVLAAFSVGKGIGDWLYENSSAIRAIGDEMGRLVAYADAIFTERTFADVNKFYQTSAQAEAEALARKKEAEAAAQAAAEAEKQRAIAAEKAAAAQAAAQEALRRQIQALSQEINNAQSSMKMLEQNGLAGGEMMQFLSTQAINAKNQLEALKASANVGVIQNTGLTEISNALKTLNLSFDELSTGINAKANQAIGAFATLAESGSFSATELGRAYAATAAQIGNNQTAQEALNTRLLEAVGGQQELADAVKQAAAAHQSATGAISQQDAALAQLGISMAAVNQQMSKSGAEMLATFEQAIGGIVSQAQNARAAGAALSQAFDVSIAAAKTRQDFERFYQVLQRTGTLSKLSAEQLSYLKAGMQGGAEAAKQATRDLQAHNQALAANNQALNQNTQAARANAAAKNAAANAGGGTGKNESKEEKATQNKEKRSRRVVRANYEITQSQEAVSQAVKDTGEESRKTAEAMLQMAASAKNTADSIAASLAELRGDSGAQERLAQEQKINELKAKMLEAQKSGNADAARQYQRAIGLQKQLYQEKQIKAQEQAAKAQNPSSTANTGTAAAAQQVGNTLSAEAVAAAWDKKIAEAEQRGAEMGKQLFARELYEAAKRKAQ